MYKDDEPLIRPVHGVRVKERPRMREINDSLSKAWYEKLRRGELKVGDYQSPLPVPVKFVPRPAWL